jgi:hypothetical protein
MLQMTLNSLEEDLIIDGPDAWSNLVAALNNRVSTTIHHDKEPYPFLTSLRSLLDWLPKEEVLKGLETFASDNVGDYEFLLYHSINLELESISRTYLFLDHSGPLSIIGYFTMGTSHLSFSDIGVADRLLPEVWTKDSVVPTFAIWKLCPGKDCHVTSSEMLAYAISMIKFAYHRTGCRFVRTDCIHSDSKIYEDTGFRFIRTDSRGERDQLLLVL